MATISVNSDAGKTSSFTARTDQTVAITCYNADGSVRTITGYGFRAIARISDGGRMIKLYTNCSGGGMSITSGRSGIVTLTIDKNDLPPMPQGQLEIVEYSGGAITGDPSDRYRFWIPVQKGSY